MLSTSTEGEINITIFFNKLYVYCITTCVDCAENTAQNWKGSLYPLYGPSVTLATLGIAILQPSMHDYTIAKTILQTSGCSSGGASGRYLLPSVSNAERPSGSLSRSEYFQGSGLQFACIRSRNRLHCRHMDGG